jgi:rubrerythrin
MTEQFKVEMARMTALAERLASEGQMSLNKLTEAAVYAQIRRAGWQYRPLVTKDRMQVELASSIQALKQSELSPALLTALETGLEYLQSGRDITHEQAPDVFVCRTCGHAALGKAPDHCPDCGSWPGRFRKFVAFFNGDNRDPINPIFVLDLLEESVTAVKQLTGGLSEDAMHRKPSPNEWSIRDHMAHFYDTQEMLDVRVKMMLEYDDPDLTAVAVYELATKTERHPQTVRGIVEAFSQKRLACVKRLRARSLNDLYRTGQHPGFGQMTILRQAAYLANHEQDHLPEIEALCQQAG